MIASLSVLTELHQDAQEHSRRRSAPALVAASAAPTTAPTPSLERLSSGDLTETLHRRRAHRFFTDGAMSLEALTAMTAAAHEMDAALWPAEHAADRLEFVVAVQRVTGMAPGVYVESGGRFAQRSSLPPGAGLTDLVLQSEFGNAAAILVAVGSLQAALDQQGSHGHRLLLERSGAACEAAWLTAVAADYGGSIFAGFLPAALRSLAGVDGYRRTQLLALAVGRPTAVNDGPVPPVG